MGRVRHILPGGTSTLTAALNPKWTLFCFLFALFVCLFFFNLPATAGSSQGGRAVVSHTRPLHDPICVSLSFFLRPPPNPLFFFLGLRMKSSTLIVAQIEKSTNAFLHQKQKANSDCSAAEAIVPSRIEAF